MAAGHKAPPYGTRHAGTGSTQAATAIRPDAQPPSPCYAEPVSGKHVQRGEAASERGPLGGENVQRGEAASERGPLEQVQRGEGASERGTLGEPNRAAPEPSEPPPSLPVYFGGYALVFVAVLAFAMLLVLAARCLR